MALQRPEYYVVDDAPNFSSTNAVTQKDVLYYERDTGRSKLGTGSRWNDVPYYVPGVSVEVDDVIRSFIREQIESLISVLDVEPRIAEKRSAFNLDFGETKETIARGRHQHNVNDITDLKLPQEIIFPRTPLGNVLHDDGHFKHVDAIPASLFNAHVKSGGHLSAEEIRNSHPPVQVAGPGIGLDGQTVYLRVGLGRNDVCPGEHAHDEYSSIYHVHTEEIEASRLPLLSRNEKGVVPPTGNPSGRCLLDNGSWGFQDAMSIVQFDAFWVAPVDCEIVVVAVSSQGILNSGITINNGKNVYVNSGSTKVQDVFFGSEEVSIPVKKGDVIQRIGIEGSVQLGIVIPR